MCDGKFTMFFHFYRVKDNCVQVIDFICCILTLIINEFKIQILNNCKMFSVSVIGLCADIFYWTHKYLSSNFE